VKYRAASTSDIDFFDEHGWIVVEDVIEPVDLAEVEARCQDIIDHKDELAYDWAWEQGEERTEREFRILQGSLSYMTSDFDDARFRLWAIEFGSALMGFPMEFWYDQFLAKPRHISVPTKWHQDEAYWGRNLDDKGITCWMPFHDVDVSSGCMHFIDRGHRDGVLTHQRPPQIQSDLLECEPDESRTVACPVKVGSVTFHHSKTPHMTTANTSREWRKVLTQHLRQRGCPNEGDHYPWKVWVDQTTGQVIRPETR
jgi:ectoine hydroxylase-related dioxygenase (phytanoyl-CoA dioxygenase family)